MNMRHLILVSILAALLVVGLAPAALGHVHGVTPLLELGCKVDNAITGGNRADDGPAGAADGGPITGLIPRDVGSAPLTGGDGGFGAASDSVCP
jgi:hypothetical protein